MRPPGGRCKPARRGGEGKPLRHRVADGEQLANGPPERGEGGSLELPVAEADQLPGRPPEREEDPVKRPQRGEYLRLGVAPGAAPGLRGAARREDPVDGPPRRLVRALHRRQVGVGANVVGGEHEVLDRGRRLGAVVPRAGGVDQQRLEVLRRGRVGVHDVRVEERSASTFASSSTSMPGVVEAPLELGPDLVAHLLARSSTWPACRCCPAPPSRRRRRRGSPPPARRPAARSRRRARTGAGRSRSAPRGSRCRGCGREPRDVAVEIEHHPVHPAGTQAVQSGQLRLGLLDLVGGQHCASPRPARRRRRSPPCPRSGRPPATMLTSAHRARRGVDRLRPDARSGSRLPASAGARARDRSRRRWSGPLRTRSTWRPGRARSNSSWSRIVPPVRALISRALAATSVRVSPSARNLPYSGERSRRRENSHQLWCSYSANRRSSQLVSSRSRVLTKLAWSRAGIPSVGGACAGAEGEAPASRRGRPGKCAGVTISARPSSASWTWLAATRLAATPSACRRMGSASSCRAGGGRSPGRSGSRARPGRSRRPRLPEPGPACSSPCRRGSRASRRRRPRSRARPARGRRSCRRRRHRGR